MKSNFKLPVKQPSYMLETLQSQLVVRNTEDAVRVKDLAEYMTYLNNAILNISSTEMIKEVNMVKDIYSRLINVEVIKYDVDEHGNPLVTRRERQLLYDLISKYTKKDKAAAKVQQIQKSSVL
jgi:hypothetical protein